MNLQRRTQMKAATSAVDTSVKAHSQQALIVQGYALSVLQQPHVDFAGFVQLKPRQDEINGGIDRAKTHAKTYLDTILPALIGQIANVDAYFNVQDAIPKALSTSSDPKTAIRFMKIAAERSRQYQTDAEGLVAQLQKLRTDLSSDSAAFAGFVANLNAAVEGDQGVLASIDKQLSSIDGKIAGAISGTVLSGLAIFGGAFLIVLGAATEIFTGGASTAAIAGGVGLLATGIGGEVASAITLAKLIDLKSDLIGRKAKLKAEVALASTISSGFNSLSEGAAGAAAATQLMANAWSGLGDHLGNLIVDLEQGAVGDADIRALFQAAAAGDVADVRRDVGVIKQQLTGAGTVVDVKTPVARLIVDNARKIAA